MKKRFLWGIRLLFVLLAGLLPGAAGPGGKKQCAPQPLPARAAHYERVMASFAQGGFSAFYAEEGDHLTRSRHTAAEMDGRNLFPFGNSFARQELNGDGRDELVRSETAEAGVGDGVHRIRGIFRYKKAWTPPGYP